MLHHKSSIMMAAVARLPVRRENLASGYRMRKSASDRAEIYLYGVIGQDWFGDGITAKKFADDLKALGKVKNIDLRINSEGGDVFAGKAMYTLLVDHAAKIAVHIDGLAASAASFIAMAGDTIEISEGAFVMIHNAWTLAMGSAEDMRRTADLLDAVDGTIVDVYSARTKNSVADIKKWMADETWMNGAEAVKNGFADSVVENLKVAAAVRDASRFRHLPAALRPNRARAAAALAAMA